MRNLSIEAAIWTMFTSEDFYFAVAAECDSIAKWFGGLARSNGVEGFGRNNQIYDLFKKRGADFQRGAELSKLGDYEPVWNVARLLRGDTRGIMDQPLRAWMTKEEEHEFNFLRLGRLHAYTSSIESSLNNAMYGATGFFNPNPDHPLRRDDDDGFPGDQIFDWYSAYVDHYEPPFFWKLPEPIPEYVIDKSIACETGEEVPMTGVWFPDTGLDNHSLTFAVKGRRMQPVYRVVKTKEQLKAEGFLIPRPKTVAVSTVWHLLVEAPREKPVNDELWAKADQQCPKEGIWQPTDPGAAQRYYRFGEPMLNLGSAHGYTVWRWIADR